MGDGDLLHREHPQKWLEMAVIDLLESKRTEAAALENVDILLEEKEILKEKLSIQQELCRLEKEKLQDALTRIKRDYEGKRSAQEYEIAHLKFAATSERQKSLCFKLRLDGAVDEVDILSSRLQTLTSQLTVGETEAVQEKRSSHYNQRLRDEQQKKHEIEVQSLRSEQSNVCLMWKQEVSALMREKNFVWDQFKRMEDDYSTRISLSKRDLKAAEANLQRLQLRVEELQRAHDEKTVEATVLRINVQTAEEELCKLRKELLQLNQGGNVEIDEEPKFDSRKINENGMLNEKTEVSQEIQEVKLGISEVTNALVEKEDELKKSRKLMDELRRENENLKMLYADLEGQLKNKQKPEKPKDAATRNLTAELEAVATTTNAVSPKVRHDKNTVSQTNIANVDLTDHATSKTMEVQEVSEHVSNAMQTQKGRVLSDKTNIPTTEDKCVMERNSGSRPRRKGGDAIRRHTDVKRKQLISGSAINKTVRKREKPTLLNESFPKILSGSQNFEINYRVENKYSQDLQASGDGTSLPATANVWKNRLFSSGFGIPKVITSGT